MYGQTYTSTAGISLHVEQHGYRYVYGDAVLPWCEDDGQEEDPRRRMAALGSFFP
jgi:hypothetical protein